MTCICTAIQPSTLGGRETCTSAVWTLVQYFAQLTSPVRIMACLLMSDSPANCLLSTICHLHNFSASDNTCVARFSFAGFAVKCLSTDSEEEPASFSQPTKLNFGANHGSNVVCYMNSLYRMMQQFK